MSTEIRNSIEINAGNVIGKVVVGFNPSLKLCFGFRNDKAENGKVKQPAGKHKLFIEPKQHSDGELWNGSRYWPAIINQDAAFELRFPSGEIVVVAVHEGKDENSIEDDKLSVPSDSSSKHDISFYFEEKFPVSVIEKLYHGYTSGNDSSHESVFIVSAASSKYGKRLFIIPPHHQKNATKTAALKNRTIITPKREKRSIRIVNDVDDQNTDENTYYLDWPPQKLGEGSFGAVYLGRDADERPVAIKVLYARQFSTGTGLISILPDDMEYIKNGFAEPSTNKKSSGTEKLSHVNPSELASLVVRGLYKKSTKNKDMPKAVFDEIEVELIDILNRSSIGNELSKSRFSHESEIDKDIREAHRKLGLRASQKYVKVLNSTETFHTSNAYKALSEYYEETGSGTTLNLSGFAIILELFDYTLKDLLERQYNDEDETSTESNSQARLGYDLLAGESFEDRAKIAIPFLKGVADSLVEIHLADQMHHDIKPGNIFVNRDGTRTKVRLGDFSFVGKLDDPGSSEAELRDFVGLGEMHYRSPEQNDFMEIMQAEIFHDINDYPAKDERGENVPEFVIGAIKNNSTFFMRVRDPKFRESLIGKRDKFVLSSDQDGAVYPIDFVFKGDSYWDIWTDIEGDHLRKRFHSTKKAQVIFFKIPTRQTDLFGLGGLAYELLTAGGSPARFYEKLRAIDQVGSSLSIDDLINAYTLLQKSDDQTVDPVKRSLLGAFFDVEKSDHAPTWIVEFILRCITFNLDGSYYRMFHSATSESDDVSRVEASIASEYLDEMKTELKIGSKIELYFLNPLVRQDNSSDDEQINDEGENVGDAVISYAAKKIRGVFGQ